MNNGFDSEKRILTAVVLSMALLFAYPYLVKLIVPPKPVVKEAATTGAATVGQAAQGASAPHSAPANAKVVAVGAKEVFSTVETPLWKAVFSSHGGSVKSWDLKKFTATNQPGSANVNLTADVISRDSLTTSIRRDNVLEPLNFSLAGDGLTLKDTDSKEFVFSATASNGVRVEKSYTFTGASYMFDAQVKVSNPTSSAVELSVVTALAGPFAKKDATGYHNGPLVYAKDKVFRATEKEASNGADAAPKWIGMEDKYFLAAVMPSATMQAGWKTEVNIVGQSSSASMDVPVKVAPGAEASFSYKMFMGPKEYDLLLMQKNGLEEAIEFGMFSFMAKPSLVVLNFFKRYLANYGLAIILFTVILKVAFFPLTKHSLTSMKEMQKIQPQLVYLKEKYKDNKERLNKEMMDLYKRYKINPVSGCLPMVLQIPVFIALYEVLYVAIELRHAPLGLWIHDLSDKDPYYITPLVMGATMFIQQKMTPTSADPMQSKIMLFMPIIFTFMFLKFPSGLVVYWLVNNLLTIAQQYWIQRTPSQSVVKSQS